MKALNIHEAKTHLSRLVEEVLEGKDIVIAKAGVPKVRLVPYKVQRPPRKGGQFEGLHWEADDCWREESDHPLSTLAVTPLDVSRRNHPRSEIVGDTTKETEQ